MSTCVICQLVRKEIEVSVVYEDRLCSAFMDIQPVTPGHLLVVPNHHASYLSDLREEEGARIFPVAQRIVEALRKSDLRCEGVNFFLADGEAAGQEIFHVHLHVIPRFAGDGFGLKLPPDYHDRPPRSELDEIAARLHELL